MTLKALQSRQVGPGFREYGLKQERAQGYRPRNPPLVSRDTPMSEPPDGTPPLYKKRSSPTAWGKFTKSSPATAKGKALIQ